MSRRNPVSIQTPHPSPMPHYAERAGVSRFHSKELGRLTQQAIVTWLGSERGFGLIYEPESGAFKFAHGATRGGSITSDRDGFSVNGTASHDGIDLAPNDLRRVGLAGYRVLVDMLARASSLSAASDQLDIDVRVDGDGDDRIIHATNMETAARVTLSVSKEDPPRRGFHVVFTTPNPGCEHTRGLTGRLLSVSGSIGAGGVRWQSFQDGYSRRTKGAAEIARHFRPTIDAMMELYAAARSGQLPNGKHFVRGVPMPQACEYKKRRRFAW